MKSEAMYREEFWKGKRDSLRGLFGLPKIKWLIDFVYMRAGLLRAKDQAKWVLSSCKPRNILEIGCGYGEAIRFWHKKGYDITGVEPDKHSCERINRKVGKGIAYCGSIELFKSRQKYDLIIMSHVLEHLENLPGFFKTTDKLLKKDSAIFVEVPNCEHKLTLEDSRSNPAHLHHFTSKSLKKEFITQCYVIARQETLISKLDLITEKGLSKFQRVKRLFDVLVAKDKSVKAPANKANIIRLIAVKNK
ncbi:class I SAM-dependent methyltransferase [Candidatus Woesearchaeota archaeon]|nr:class I SAM-dependent methyltransferase [Candidatus Woesearchaeota archaeon]